MEAINANNILVVLNLGGSLLFIVIFFCLDKLAGIFGSIHRSYFTHIKE
jgi:hypothetical protein